MRAGPTFRWAAGGWNRRLHDGRHQSPRSGPMLRHWSLLKMAGSTAAAAQNTAAPQVSAARRSFRIGGHYSAEPKCAYARSPLRSIGQGIA
jgi:hypothetical protein